jgi:RNA polymerase-binding transcription factor DksA
MTDNNNLSPNNEGAEFRIGVVQPATKNTPAMRLNANDAEILATAKERYSNKDLEMFRKLINEQRAEASEEFDILSEQMLDTSGEFDADNQSFSLHTAEQGTDAMEREKTFLHAQRTSDYIKKLDEAMARIDRGTYGSWYLWYLRRMRQTDRETAPGRSADHTEARRLQKQDTAEKADLGPDLPRYS